MKLLLEKSGKSVDHLKCLDEDTGKFLCSECLNFDEGNCKFSNYYGKWKGDEFNGKVSEQKMRHYHASCVKMTHMISDEEMQILATMKKNFLLKFHKYKD